MVQLLLNYRDLDTGLYDTAHNEWTALHWAAAKGHADIVRLLLGHFNQLSEYQKQKHRYLKGDFNNRNVIDLAVEAGHTDVLRVFLDQWKYDLFGPLLIAAQKGYAEVVKLLLERGADVNKFSEFGDQKTALIFACEQGKLEVVKVLLASGVNVHFQDACGRTALMWASYKGHAEVVKALLAAGARIDYQDDRGSTALMNASFLGHKDVVTVLLDSYARTDLKDQNGDDALYYANRSSDTTIADLVQKGPRKLSVTWLKRFVGAVVVGSLCYIVSKKYTQQDQAADVPGNEQVLGAERS